MRGLLSFDSTQMNHFQEEFVAYQLLDQPDIPDTVWEETIVYHEGKDGTTIWGHIATLNVDGFELLSKVARMVLVIPHSNAGEEGWLISSDRIKHLHVFAWTQMELWHL